MKSPDEFHYGFEEPPKEPNAVVCAVCGDIIRADDSAVVIERDGGDPLYYHERCVSTANEEFAEAIGLHLEFGRGWEIEHD